MKKKYDKCMKMYKNKNYESFEFEAQFIQGNGKTEYINLKKYVCCSLATLIKWNRE